MAWLWRPTAIFQYLAVFLWMLLPVFAMRGWAIWREASDATPREAWLVRGSLAAWMCYVGGGAVAGYLATGA